MNILEAYIKKYKQIIILILGLPCTNKSEIAKELSNDLNLQVININNFLIKDKYKEIKINDTIFNIYEDTNNYNWKKFNSDINKFKKKGVILYGNYLDIDKFKSNIDFIFFYSMNTTLCKKILIDKKLIEWDESNPITKLYFDEIFNPMYEKLKNNLIINKFYNIKEDMLFNELYDDIFNLLMDLITKKLNN